MANLFPICRILMDAWKIQSYSGQKGTQSPVFTHTHINNWKKSARQNTEKILSAKKESMKDEHLWEQQKTTRSMDWSHLKKKFNDDKGIRRTVDKDERKTTGQSLNEIAYLGDGFLQSLVIRQSTKELRTELKLPNNPQNAENLKN